MTPAFGPSSLRRSAPMTGGMLGIVLLVLPLLLLLIGGLRACGRMDTILLLAGGGFQLVTLACLGLAYCRRRLESVELFIILLHVLGLAWVGLGPARFNDWYAHLVMAELAIVPLLFFAQIALARWGVAEVRRARLLSQSLANRSDWPADLEACKMMPEVKALREMLRIDASPALEILGHKRREVQIAALAAMECRAHWRQGQAEWILHAAQNAVDVPVRVAALHALSNVHEESLIRALVEFLRDPAPEVRGAAREILLWDLEHRWKWLRDAVRTALADPVYKDDGPMPIDEHEVSAEVIADLTAWTSEKGILGMRSSMTLAAHYKRLLADQPTPELLNTLHQHLADPQIQPTLRLELAQILHNCHLLDHDMQVRLLNPTNPASLRLLAVDALLSEADHDGARTALRELARLPNRDMALAAAAVVQKHLGVDLGLALGQEPPPIHSRQAADVTRRVMRWADEKHSETRERAMSTVPR